MKDSARRIADWASEPEPGVTARELANNAGWDVAVLVAALEHTTSEQGTWLIKGALYHALAREQSQYPGAVLLLFTLNVAEDYWTYETRARCVPRVGEHVRIEHLTYVVKKVSHQLPVDWDRSDRDMWDADIDVVAGERADVDWRTSLPQYGWKPLHLA